MKILLSPHHPNPHTFLLSTGGVEIISELLHHRVEQFSSFQLVLAGSAPPASWWNGMKQADIGRQRFSQLIVQTLNLTPLECLQLRDLLHVSINQSQEENKEISFKCCEWLTDIYQTHGHYACKSHPASPEASLINKSLTHNPSEINQNT